MYYSIYPQASLRYDVAHRGSLNINKDGKQQKTAGLKSILNAINVSNSTLIEDYT